MAYTYEFKKALASLDGCLTADSYMGRAMEPLSKNARVTLAAANEYDEYMAAKEEGDEPEGLNDSPFDFPYDYSFSKQGEYLSRLCTGSQGEMKVFLIRKDENSPAYVMRYDAEENKIVLSEEPLIPSAEKYAQQAEKLKKPLPTAPNIFQKIGHFFSTLFGGEGNETVNAYNRALDENEAIVYKALCDAGYKVEKPEAVMRWEKLQEAVRVPDAPQKKNVVVHTHEKMPDEERTETRKENFVKNNLQKYTDKTDTLFVSEMTKNLQKGIPAVQDYILTLDEKTLDMICKFCREQKDPKALEQMLIKNAGIMKQQNNKQPNDKQMQPQPQPGPEENQPQSEPFVLKN